MGKVPRAGNSPSAKAIVPGRTSQEHRACFEREDPAPAGHRGWRERLQTKFTMERMGCGYVCRLCARNHLPDHLWGFEYFLQPARVRFHHLPGKSVSLLSMGGPAARGRPGGEGRLGFPPGN